MPLRVLAGTGKDVYRKPNIGMFDVVQAVYKARGYEIDLEKSLFVGDAAGRFPHQGRPADHSDTDFKFALNAGLKFTTPEVSGILGAMSLSKYADYIRNTSSTP
jgi:bifunctional polynucleotide phosphatase/kinase